jgi:putative ABC transport system permease protein
LLRTPSFTLAALLCLALGIGATTAIFSIVNGVLLRPLPYPAPNGLVRLYTEFPTFPGGGLSRFWVSEPEVFDLRKAKSFDRIGAWATTGVNIAGLDKPLRATATYASSEIFEMLRVAPLRGHLITRADDKPGAPQVLVLSFGLWQRAFGGDPNVIGKRTYLNNEKVTVIAVMPKGFIFPPGEPDASEAWAALQLDPNSQSRGGHNFNVLGRLREGVSLRQARQEMAGLVARWGETASPNRHEFTPKDHPVSMYWFYDEVVGGVRKAMLMLLGAVAFLLLIACVNVANLLLARSEARQREVAMRRAVGASGGQLLQQFILEGIILSLIGAVLGCLLAAQSLRLIRILGTDSIPRVAEIGMDWRVLCFALIISILTGVLFGLAPFVQVSSIRVFDVLKNVSSRASGSVTANRFRHGLVVFQMAMAFLLVAGAGLMVRSFWKLQQINPGFNPEGILTAQVSLPSATYKEAGARTSFWRRVQERLNQLPGVTSATILSGLPPLRPENDNDTQIEGFVPVPNGPIQNVAYWQSVGDKFFETVGTRLIDGRFLTPQDGVKETLGVVVNAAMANTFWPHKSAIGRRIRLGGSKDPWYRVVGVISDIKNGGLEKPAGTELFMSYRAPEAQRYDYYVALKTASSPALAASEIRRVVSGLDPSLPISKVRTMEDVVAASRSRPRFLTTVLTIFSVLALALAAVGTYGVIAYSVEQRTSEFGIRMALGAEPQRLLLGVIGQGLLLGFIGVCVGLVFSSLLTSSLRGLTFGVSGFDAQSFVVTTALLTLVSVAASALPALRAVSVEPVKALRYE